MFDLALHYNFLKLPQLTGGVSIFLNTQWTVKTETVKALQDSSVNCSFLKATFHTGTVSVCFNPERAVKIP